MQNILLPIIIVIVMVFWMTRTQKKQQARQAEMRSQMQKGSDVVTIGGLHAKIDAVNEEAKTVDLNCEGVILTFDMQAIRSVKNAEAAKPAAEAASTEEEKKED